MPVDRPAKKAQPLAVRLGQAIRSARRSMSQSDLASKVGVDQGTVSKWETGKQRPSLEEINAIEKACGRHHGWVLIMAGVVDPVITIEQAIAVDGRLDDEGRKALLIGLEMVLS